MNKIVKFSVILVAVLVIIGGVTSWRAHGQLKEAIAELREAGEPVTIADLEPKNIDPDENATVYLSQVVKEASLLDDRLYSQLVNFSWREGLPDEQLKKVEGSFATHPNVILTLELAARCEQFAWPRDYSVNADAFLELHLPQAQYYRSFARVHDARIRYLAATGKHDEAAKTALRQLKLCRLQDNDPLLITFLVQIACRSIAIHGLNNVMQVSDLAPETHKAIEEELKLHDDMNNFVHALKTDRAYGIDVGRSNKLLAVFQKQELNSYLKLMNAEIAIGPKSHYELENLKKKDAKKGLGFLAKNMDPALEASREAMNRCRAMFRCLRILNAIHASAKDAEKVHVDALGLPEKITIDPYNGKPLTVKKIEHGWVVYSVGTNRTDEGGKLKDLADVGFGPPELTQ